MSRYPVTYAQPASDEKAVFYLVVVLVDYSQSQLSVVRCQCMNFMRCMLTLPFRSLTLYIIDRRQSGGVEDDFKNVSGDQLGMLVDTIDLILYV